MTASYTSPQPDTYSIDAEAWWVQQWVDLLNSYRFKKRLERGRRYAREGHILSLEFKAEKVFAKVQGTAAEPYELSIWIDCFSDEDWDYVIDTLSQQALYSAQLLAGEMPADIEAVFTANGLSLFPFTLSDVHSRCSCPDPKNPCKHIAAVYYQLGDFFREDPFVLFQLRGKTKEKILETLRQKRRIQTDSDDTPKVTATEAAPLAAAPPLQVDDFWQYEQPLDPALVVITPSDQTVLDVLGTLPLPASDAQAVMAHLTSVYQTVAQQAMIAALS
ncbi:MAG: SWIM zinc finger family protein [Cyanobacteria bacterium P01_D01_bin.44]